MAQSDSEAYGTMWKFNIGLYMGVGGTQASYLPSIDARFCNTSIRVSPGWEAFGVGLTQELKVFNPHISSVPLLISTELKIITTT